jgi:hypothetical protein
MRALPSIALASGLGQSAAAIASPVAVNPN